MGKDHKRIISVSDLHIHDDSRCEQVYRLCFLLDQEKPDLLVLNGDIGDPWQAPWDFIRGTVSWRRLATTCQIRQEAGLETVWVNRNHDYSAKKGYLPGVKLCGEYQEGTFLFMHGWEFDIAWGGLLGLPGIAPVAFWLSRKAPWLMLPIYNLIYRKRHKSPSQQKHTTREDWNLHVGVIHLRAREYARKKRVSVIIGHTHCPTYYDELMADAGDWVDSFSCIDIHYSDLGPRVELWFVL